MRFAVIAATVLASATAFANGRPPLTNGITFKPGDPHTIYLATTFGLLISHDDGCTFDWICEDNLGYSGPYDPDYAVGSDGTIFATTDDGLRVSRDGACSFTTATAQLADGDPNKIAGHSAREVDIGPGGEVWVVTGDNGKSNDVYVSTDNGMTFAPRGLASTMRFWKSVTVAPSDGKVVYVAGYEVGTTPKAHLLRTSDGGAHWTESPLTGVVVGAAPAVQVRAIDPANADIIYAVSVEPTPGADQLYRSSDGGTTFTKVLDLSAGFVHNVLVSGNEVFVTTYVQQGMYVIGGPAYHSLDHGVTFPAIPSAPQLGCIAKRSDGVILGCGANWDPDFMAVARSMDNGATFEKVWRFVEMAGPLQCQAGTAERDTCDVQQWQTVHEQFGTKGPACGANAGVDTPAPPKSSGGCCEASGEPAADALWAFGVLWLVSGSRRSARRSRRSPAR